MPVIIFIIVLICMAILLMNNRLEKIWYFLKHDPGELGDAFRKHTKGKK